MKLNHDDFVLGLNEIEKVAILSGVSRSMHISAMGATGTGKTESLLLPLALKEMELGKCVIFVDPKGDVETLKSFKQLAEISKRSADLVIINLAKPDPTHFYNPIKVGSPTELKDKIVGSIIWTEEYYKKCSEKALLDIFQYFVLNSETPTISTIDQLLNDPDHLNYVRSGNAPNMEYALDVLKARMKAQGRDIEGLKTDITLWARSDFKDLLSSQEGESILDWIQSRKLVYVNLNTLGFEETSRRFGRLLLQDLKTAVQRIQDLEENMRPNTSVILDEFASIASSGFVELLNKARSANVSLTLAHQSLGDLEAVSASFRDQVLDNTNCKVIFRVDSPDTVDYLARLFGTRKSEKRTNRTQNSGLLGSSDTGMGSVREAEEFIVSPNDIKRLERGQAIVLTKLPYKFSKVRFKPSKQIIHERTQTSRRRSVWFKSLCWS